MIIIGIYSILSIILYIVSLFASSSISQICISLIELGGCCIIIWRIMSFAQCYVDQVRYTPLFKTKKYKTPAKIRRYPVEANYAYWKFNKNQKNKFSK
jgi:hypothetical protein